MANRSFKEVEEYHPVVAEWLDENGYSYEHHVELDDGIVDFIAIHNETGEILSVEAKVNTGKRGRFFAQALDYARQIPDSIPCVALPSWQITDKTREVCEYYGIRMLVIEIDQPEPQATPVNSTKNGYDPVAKEKFDTHVRVMNCAHALHTVIDYQGSVLFSEEIPSSLREKYKELVNEIESFYALLAEVK